MKIYWDGKSKNVIGNKIKKIEKAKQAHTKIISSKTST